MTRNEGATAPGAVPLCGVHSVVEVFPDAHQPWQPRRCQNSASGTRTRVARVRAEYPNQLDYSGSARLHLANLFEFLGENSDGAVTVRAKLQRAFSKVPFIVIMARPSAYVFCVHILADLAEPAH